MDTNIPGLETKVSVESLKAVTRPQVISDGQCPETCFETFSRAIISSEHLVLSCVKMKILWLEIGQGGHTIFLV